MGKCFQSFKSGRCCFIFFLLTIVIGAALLVGGILSNMILDVLIDAQIKDQIVMKDEHSSYFTQTWVSFVEGYPDAVPIYKNFRVFNITNPEEILAGQTPIFVKELGPYTYRENKFRFNVSFVGDSLLHRQVQSYSYIPAPGQNPDTDFVYTPNAALITLFKLLQAFPDSVKQVVDYIRQQEKAPGIIVKLSVSQLLWGYEDPLLKYIHSLPVIGGLISPIVPGIDNNQTVESQLAFSHHIISTGRVNLDTVLQYLTWQGQTEIMGIWVSPEKVTGTDASQFHRNIQRTDELTAWLDPVLRAVTLDYMGDVTVRDINCYSFGLSNNTMKNATLYPPNAKYYQLGPSGVGNISSIQKGAPAFISKPHFLDADPIYSQNIAGLYPIRSIHDTVVNVEPTTGATMSAYKRIQANVHLDPIAALDEFKNVPSVLTPVAWLEEYSVITPKYASQLKDALALADTMKTAIHWSMIGLGIVTLITSALLLFVALKRRWSAEQQLYASLKDSTEEDP